MRSRLRPALVYVVFLAVCFLVVDVALGSYAARSTGSFRTAHPYYHHGLRPLRSAESTWGGRSYRMHTNSLGFRDASPVEVPRRAQGTRVIVIGDSMLEGLGVRYEDTVAGLLAARGRARGVEVLDAAVVSYSPKLYELRTRWLVEHEGVELRRLVVFLDVSDIHDEILYESFVPRTDPDAFADGLAWWRSHSLAWQLQRRFGGDRTRIDNRFRRDAEIDVWMRTVDAYRNATGNPDVGRWEWTHDDAAFHAWGERGLALAESHMSALAGFCRAHGIELVLVVFPSPYQILAGEREGRQVSSWRGFSEREQVTFVNLFPTFVDPLRASPVSTYERYFIPDDVHWNEAGHALVAGQVEEAVLGPIRR